MTYFKPAGVPLRALGEVVLTVDQVEALRLADAEGMYQDAAAQAMGVSRATFGRIIAEARRNMALALVNGLAIRVEGGSVTMPAGAGKPVMPPAPGFGVGAGGQGWGAGRGGGRGRRGGGAGGGGGRGRRGRGGPR